MFALFLSPSFTHSLTHSLCPLTAWIDKLFSVIQLRQCTRDRGNRRKWRRKRRKRKSWQASGGVKSRVEPDGQEQENGITVNCNHGGGHEGLILSAISLHHTLRCNIHVGQIGSRPPVVVYTHLYLHLYLYLYLYLFQHKFLYLCLYSTRARAYRKFHGCQNDLAKSTMSAAQPEDQHIGPGSQKFGTVASQYSAALPDVPEAIVPF